MTTISKRPFSPTSETTPHKKARLFASQRGDDDKPQPGAKVDPTYGQRSAFPGLEEDEQEGDGELFYGPAEDGMVYLKMVRLEAKGVPNLLIAPFAAPTSEEKNLYSPYESNGKGFYSDGAYIAVPSAEVLERPDEGSDQDPQEAYYIALLQRFESLRTMLSATPPSPTPQIDPNVRSLLGKPRPGAWKHALLKCQPTPFLLCSISQESSILGIEVLESLITMRNLSGGVRYRLGTWAWGLLGRCRSVSEMDSEDVSVLRGLGKKACALLRRLQAGEELNEGVENDDVKGATNERHDKRTSNADGSQNDSEKANTEAISDGEIRDEDDEFESCDNEAPQSALAGPETLINGSLGNVITEVSHTEQACFEDARKRLLAGLSPVEQASVKSSDGSKFQPQSTDTVLVSDAHATLDVIITLIGECYGQRDLLDARLAWEELP